MGLSKKKHGFSTFLRGYNPVRQLFPISTENLSGQLKISPHSGR